ncbi:hypothetical protein F441_16013 [Phytophthora nicotianae CJ01A1]|uniref:Uncharacterized protein n=2 Tax=Phytophthora nicotianae TaxID=4792 RepID=W2G5I7_PHYNI|nr:hypothetical protein L915_15741 [Phytophthora nicotianae]ETL31640.1 hypothetical protein L916_15632 [Phytophthora nicotianae]ETP07886.1 hypothetical protein F441_16013 [Phytophthora nicotianae CJ01A1]
MASSFALSPIQPRTKLAGMGSLDPLALIAARRRRKETVNERVEHILRGALRDAEEEALQEREGDPETRGRALQRSHQLAALYTTSTSNRFLRSRAKRDASLQRIKETKPNHDSEIQERSKTESEYAGSVIGEGNESDNSDDDSVSGIGMILTSPIKLSLSTESSISIGMSPVKLKPWYGSSRTASLKEQLPPGITLDAKLRRYGARGTAKLNGWRSQDALEPLSPNHSVAPIDEFVSGISGSPSLWPPETFHPSGSRLRVTMTRCPSSPIAVPVEVSNTQNFVNPLCQPHREIQEALQQKATQKLQTLYKQEKRIARQEKIQNQRSMTEWQSRTLHFEATSELADHREQQKADPQLRHRRTQVSAIVQTPGYSPEKQRSKESSELYKKRFKLRWRSFARLLDAMRRTPCRRPVLQDMEKLFALARELGALNALGICTLSRAQFTLLITREFPLCELKHVNRLFSSYDWKIRDSVDTRIVLGTLRAMRVQQGEPVELICASLRDFDGTSDKNVDDNKAMVSDGVPLIKALSLCCSSDEEEKDMETRAEAIWTTTLSWQRQILSRRLHGGARYNVWKAKQGTSIVSKSTMSRNSGDDDGMEKVKEEEDDEEDSKEETPELTQLVDESRVPVRRIREALKRERETLEIFTQQLLQRRHECLLGANVCSPRT